MPHGLHENVHRVKDDGNDARENELRRESLGPGVVVVKCGSTSVNTTSVASAASAGIVPSTLNVST